MEDNGLTTLLFHHPSGESIQSHAVIPECSMKGMNVYQSTGSGITYYRRYMLSSMLGIISDADTDAKEYTDNPKKTPKKLPKICSLISGYFSYDSIRYVEKIPNSCKNDLNLPDVRLLRPRTLVIYDNLKKEILNLELLDFKNKADKNNLLFRNYFNKFSC